jgi:broad specificity phosphatase PhoE
MSPGLTTLADKQRVVENTMVLVRHGETDWNREERFQGRLDIPLNDAGRSQAEMLKRELAGFAFDVVYSSPLKRALETAQIVAGTVPVQCDSRLIEIHHGSWQGKTKQDIAGRWPDDWNRWNTEPERFTPPGGESAADVRARVADFLSALRGTRILCVSHGVVVQTFLSLVIGGRYLDHTSYVPANGSIHVLKLNPTS